MATAHDDPDGPDTSPYVRVPWPYAALGILVVLGVFLGLGLWATQARRAASAGPPLAAPSEPTLAPTREPPFAPLTPASLESLPQPTVALTPPPPRPTPVPLTPTRIPAAPTHVPSAQSTPTSPQDPPPTATPMPIPPALRAEIVSAYKQYWDVLAEALQTLDESRLAEFEEGEHLQNVRTRLDELRAERHAIHVKVEHRYAIIAASPSEAQINDVYQDESFYVDLDTGAPLSTAATDSLDETYTMTKVDGVWRVTDVVRYSP